MYSCIPSMSLCSQSVITRIMARCEFHKSVGKHGCGPQSVIPIAKDSTLCTSPGAFFAYVLLYIHQE